MKIHTTIFCGEVGIHGWPLVHVTCTLQQSLGYDRFWVVEEGAYSVNQIAVACVVTLRDLSKLTSSLGYILCEPVHAVELHMLFNLSIT